MGARGLVVATTLVLVAVATGTLVGASDPSASSPAEEQAPGAAPNIVLILTDDMRADELRFMPKTRRLLVRQGVRFSHAISPHPMCCPARAELVTGQYGQNNGVRHNTGRWGGTKALKDPDDNVGRWLTAAGYRTSYHGKFLNGYERLRPRREPAGWTFWDAQVGGIYTYQRARFFNGDRVRHQYVTDTMTDRTNATFEQFADGRAPFFTIINHVAPHVTLSPPNLPRWKHKYDDAARRAATAVVRLSFVQRAADRGPARAACGCRKVDPDRVQALFRARVRALRSVDDAVAATVRELDRLGELDNTYVVFTSDNGYALGEHRLSSKNYLFDEILDVPLVIRGPGFEPGTVEDTQVTLVDLVASFVDWGGATPGHPIDGLSIDRLRRRGFTRGPRHDPGPDRRPARRRHPGVGLPRRHDDPLPVRLPGGEGRHRHPLRPGSATRTPCTNRFWDRDYRAIRRELTHRTRVLSHCAGGGCNRVFGPLPEPR